MKCPTCNQEVPTDGPITTVEVIRAIEQLSVSPYYYWEAPNRYELKIRGKMLKPTIVESKRGEGREIDQGDTSNIYYILQIGDSFFKKTGYADSYGEDNWDGMLSQVSPTTKTVTVFE